MKFIDTSGHETGIACGRAFQHLPGAPSGTPSLKVQTLVKGIQKQALPACLEDPFLSKIFEAIIDWRVAHLAANQRNRLCYNLGIMYLDHGQSVIDQAISLNVSRVDRARVIGKLLGIYPERLFSVFPSIRDTSFEEETHGDGIPLKLLVGDKMFFLHIQDDQYDHRGFVSHAYLWYRSTSGQDFQVIAARTLRENWWGRKFPTLALGEECAPNWPLGMVEMDDNPGAVVILCAGLNLALTFRAKAKRANIAISKYIISCVIDGEKGLECTDLKVLAYHHVIVLPELSKDGYRDMEKFGKKLRAVNATVSVFWHPLLTDADILPEGDRWMDEEHALATNIDRVEDVTALLDRICRDADSLEVFMERCHIWGILTKGRDATQDIQADELRVVPFHDLQASPATSYKPDLKSIFRVGQISLVWGASNSGKSLTVATLALAFGSGSASFGILNTATSRKVLIVDGELEQSELHSRFQQLAEALGVVAALSNIFFIPTRSYEPSQCDLINGALAKLVCEFVKANGIEVVIIDNIITLASSAARGNEDALFALIRDIERAGANVLLVHHSTKEGDKYKGSANLASKSQNIIRIEGRNALVQEVDGSAQIADALSTTGALIRMTWEKCKSAPCLEGASKVFKLPIGEAWYGVDGDFSDAYSESSTAMDSSTEHDDAGQSLSDDEKSIMALFEDGRASIKRSDVEDTLGCKENKALIILNALKGKKLLGVDGSGRSTQYHLLK